MTSNNQISRATWAAILLAGERLEGLDQLTYAARLLDARAVATFAHEMLARMFDKAESGKEGWQNMDPAALWTRLETAVAAGRPIDVANYAMMLSLTLRQWNPEDD